MEAMTNEQLCKLAKSGDMSARELLIENNLPFIQKLANSMMALSDKSVEFEDLVQEGSIALLKAIDLYDENCGTKFLTFAGRLIKNSMTDFIRAEQNRFEQRIVSSGHQKLLSLDCEYDDGDGGIYFQFEVTADPRTQTPEQIVCHKETIVELNAALKKSSLRNQIYLDYRFGITDNEHSLSETADHFSIGIRRAKSTEKSAISFLRKEMAGKNNNLNEA